jgi:hypothetical protein
MNSRMAWSYERFELEDVRLFKTADFDCSRSGNLRTVFGTRLHLLFAMEAASAAAAKSMILSPIFSPVARISGTHRGFIAQAALR